MNAGALTEAAKTRFPMEKFVGIWWSGHDGDMKSVGQAGKGYRAISWSNPVPDSPLMQEIKSRVIDAGKSQLNAGEENWVFYQRGLMISLMLVEGIKAAQANFDTPKINAEQLRWGLENLDISEEKLTELGAAGMLVPFKTTCANHTGHGGGWMLEWDGEKFVKVSDLLTPDTATIEPLEKAEAAKYAAANAPWPTNDECKM
jgi:branched-chain amino acid transport system substrate-binding protein